MAAVLILLLIGIFSDKNLFYQIALPVLVLNMIQPKTFYPFAILWYGLSGLAGDIISRILLITIYIAVVLPVGSIRKVAGKDNLKLKKFKSSSESVMLVREHEFTAQDLEKPF